MSRKVGFFLLFVATLFVVYYLCSAEKFNLLFAVYVVVYVFLILRFTQMFSKHYHNYAFQMDNYYAGEEARHLRWVRVSFFVALAIGVLALLNALFMSEWGALLFSVVLIAFYITFAIRFLNYPFVFRYIERAMADETPIVPAKLAFPIGAISCGSLRNTPTHLLRSGKNAPVHKIFLFRHTSVFPFHLPLRRNFKKVYYETDLYFGNYYCRLLIVPGGLGTGRQLSGEKRFFAASNFCCKRRSKISGVSFAGYFELPVRRNGQYIVNTFHDT